MSTVMTKWIFAFLIAGALLPESKCEQASAAVAGDSEFSASSSQLYSLALDDVMKDALYEGLLALCAFAVFSSFFSAYQRKQGNPKPSKKVHKAGERVASASSRKDHAQARLWKRPTSVSAAQCKMAVADSAANSAVCQESSSHQRRGIEGAIVPEGKEMEKPQKASTTFSATDFLVIAVRNGRASELPQLLDQTLARACRGETALSAESLQNLAMQQLLSALRACAAAHCFSDALCAYDHVANRIGVGCSAVWSLVLYSAVEAGKYDRCETLFTKLCAEGEVSGHDIINIVRCCAHQHDVAAFKRMLGNLKSAKKEVDVFAWNRSLAACANADRGLQFAEMLAAESMCREAMDAVTYNTLMKCNARAGRFARCLELHSEMVAKGHQPSEVTFGILLDACVAAQDHEKARQIFDDLCNSGLPLNAVHCTTFIKSLAGAGQLHETAQVLERMWQTPGAKPDLITYSTIVKAYADSSNADGALYVVEQMLAQNIKPDEIVFNSVLNACCVAPASRRPSTEIMQLFDKLMKLGMRPTTTTLSICLKGLALSEAFTEAIRMLEDAPLHLSMEPEMRLFTQLTQACVKARKGGKALETFRAMVKAAKRQGVKIEEHLGRLLRHCAMCTQLDTACRLCSAASQAGIKVDPQLEKELKDAASRKCRSSRTN